MSGLVLLDRAWRKANPLPPIDRAQGKNGRGRALVVGGSLRVPGAVRLAGEAALRSGAGKLRIATAEAATVPLGLLMPEAGVVGLPVDDDGELAVDAAAPLLEQMRTCEALVLGPGMGGRRTVDALLGQVLASPREEMAVLLDAAAVACGGGLAEAMRAHGGRLVMTPHGGEMAALTGTDEATIAADPVEAARAAAARFGAVIVLKAERTVIAAPDGTTLDYHSQSVGLGCPGSGDVLAGAIGGLLARGAAPLVAAGWGVWLHGAAGDALAARIGPAGFLGRELAAELPRLLAAHASGVG